MKIKKSLVAILSIIAVITIGGLSWWNTPSSIVDINPSEVSKIDFFDGNTGKSITVTEEADIAHIINNLNSLSLKKESLSLGYVGYSFKTTIYRTNGNVYKEFIINSENKIRIDPFFYKVTSDKIDYDYIRSLFHKSDN